MQNDIVKHKVVSDHNNISWNFRIANVAPGSFLILIRLRSIKDFCDPPDTCKFNKSRERHIFNIELYLLRKRKPQKYLRESSLLYFIYFSKIFSLIN